jgi:4-amino-4-deoxy-L-arabinose transferase-like glycosyltransferase
MNRRAFIYLLPLFVLYCVVFSVVASNSLNNGLDEIRYATYAENLTKGFYAPADTRLLWNGPGYPLLLTPFAYFKIPWIYAKMLNPAFLFIAVCAFYAVIRRFMAQRTAIVFAYLFGLYPPFFAQFWYLLTEPVVIMLTAVFALLTFKWLESGKYRYMFLAGVVCGYLALTKVFFAHVAEGMLFLSVLFMFWSRTARRVWPVYVLGLLVCTPYLFYTYHLTGKPFYWANSSGEIAYWMTSTDPNDFGSWFSPEDVMTRPELASHRPFFETLNVPDFVDRDQLLKKQAIENIKQHPRKFLFNMASNVGRLFLNFPFSYKYQHPRTLLYLFPNSLVLAAMCFCVYPLIRFRRDLPGAIVHACAISLVFIGGASLIYAEARFLCTIVAFIFIIIAYVATNLVKIQPPENRQQ